MRTKRRNVETSTEAHGSQDAHYCVLCETYMLFERVDSEDLPIADGPAEWICVTCGSAVFINPGADSGSP